MNTQAEACKIAKLFKDCTDSMTPGLNYRERSKIETRYWKKIKGIYRKTIEQWWFERNNGMSVVSVRSQTSASRLYVGDFGYTTIFNRQGILRKGAVNKITIGNDGVIVSSQAITDKAFLSPADTDAAKFIYRFQLEITDALLNMPS